MKKIKIEKQYMQEFIEKNDALVFAENQLKQFATLKDLASQSLEAYWKMLEKMYKLDPNKKYKLNRETEELIEI